MRAVLQVARGIALRMPACKRLCQAAENTAAELMGEMMPFLQQETDEKELRPHGCATCAPGAWHVCEACHIALLSRDCPLCRSPEPQCT